MYTKMHILGRLCLHCGIGKMMADRLWTMAGNVRGRLRPLISEISNKQIEFYPIEMFCKKVVPPA